MKNEIKIIIALATIIVGLFFYVDYLNNKHENELLEYRNAIVERDVVLQEKDSSYSRLTYEFKSTREMLDKLKIENSKFAKDIKDRDEKIAFLISIKLKPDTVYVPVITTVKDGVANFTGYNKPYTVNGYFYFKDSTVKDLSVLMDEFKILVVESKLENGFYRARLRLSDMNNNVLPNFKVIGIESAINTETFYQDAAPFLSIGIGGQISLTKLDVGAALNLYGKNIITINYNLINENKEILPTISRKITVGYYRMLW